MEFTDFGGAGAQIGGVIVSFNTHGIYLRVLLLDLRIGMATHVENFFSLQAHHDNCKKFTQVSMRTP
jgi:hypothetical protein